MDKDSPPAFHKIRIQKWIEAIQKELQTYGAKQKKEEDDDEKLLDELEVDDDEDEGKGAHRPWVS